jgi:hypothetical protein
MTKACSLSCGLPFCQSTQNTQSKQTNLSLGLRITAVALGIIAAIAGILILCGIGSLSDIIGGSVLATGRILVILGASLKCINNKATIDNNPLQPTNKVTKGNHSSLSTNHSVIKSEDNTLPIERNGNDGTSISSNSQLQSNHVDTVTMGHGEYVVFHQLPNGKRKEVSAKTFEQVYGILSQYSPTAMHSEGIEACKNRYELIKNKIKKIDPTLEAVFIPRTLYELIFIEKCIEEDVKHNSICAQIKDSWYARSLEDFDGDESTYNDFLAKRKAYQKTRKCWHLCYFNDAGNVQHTGVKELAFRLNHTIFKRFMPSSKGFTKDELSAFAETEINFLKTHHTNMTQLLENSKAQGKSPKLWMRVEPAGPTVNFGYEVHNNRGITPMCIRNEIDAQIIRNALDLECSKVAQSALILYRGSNSKFDSTEDGDNPHSLSLGTSLFAGCIYDVTATAFFYMRTRPNGYAITVPLEKIKDSLFHVPNDHAIAQLLSQGESFHPRTKGWKGCDLNKIQGIDGVTNVKREDLKSNLSRQEVKVEFQNYCNQAVQLK